MAMDNPMAQFTTNEMMEGFGKYFGKTSVSSTYAIIEELEVIKPIEVSFTTAAQPICVVIEELFVVPMSIAILSRTENEIIVATPIVHSNAIPKDEQLIFESALIDFLNSANPTPLVNYCETLHLTKLAPYSGGPTVTHKALVTKIDVDIWKDAMTMYMPEFLKLMTMENLPLILFEWLSGLWNFIDDYDDFLIKHPIPILDKAWIPGCQLNDTIDQKKKGKTRVYEYYNQFMSDPRFDLQTGWSKLFSSCVERIIPNYKFRTRLK